MESESTRWSIIRGAARGNAAEQEFFVLRYDPVVRAYLGARWRASPLVADLDDAAQDVMLACFQPRGVLDRADPRRSFRGFLYGVMRNIARRVEEKRRELADIDLDRVEADGAALSTVFDRAWAAALLQAAAALQAERATDDRQRRRVELLRLRFQEDLPVRDIAALWKEDSAWVHHECATARQEYKIALREVVREHTAGNVTDIDEECSRLLAFFD